MNGVTMWMCSCQLTGTLSPPLKCRNFIENSLISQKKRRKQKKSFRSKGDLTFPVDWKLYLFLYKFNIEIWVSLPREHHLLTIRAKLKQSLPREHHLLTIRAKLKQSYRRPAFVADVRVVNSSCPLLYHLKYINPSCQNSSLTCRGSALFWAPVSRPVCCASWPIQHASVSILQRGNVRLPSISHDSTRSSSNIVKTQSWKRSVS
jgi:hypothetical protein